MNLIKRKNLLLICLAAETTTASYGLLAGSHTAVDSVLYLLASMVFIAVVLGLPEARIPGPSAIKNGLLIKLPILFCMIVVAFVVSRYWFFRIPLDPDYADMLPVMKVMNQRFLEGRISTVYDPIAEIWNGTRPIYLPAMWLPYAPAIAMEIDMRWITVLSLLIAFAIILLFIQFQERRYPGWVMIGITVVLFWWIFARNDIHGLISMSEEGVVIFYFVLLTLAIISGNVLWIGVTVSLCMLSRYSLIGWILPFMIYLLSQRAYRKLLIFSLTGIGFFVFFFVIPFGWETLDQMIALPGNYVAFAKHIWEFSPEVFWLNPGMAKFFGPHHVESLHHTLIAVSLILPVLFIGYCLIQKKWKLYNVPVACLKLSLLIFYQFIDVPYGYLFYTGSFVSIVITLSILNVREDHFEYKKIRSEVK